MPSMFDCVCLCVCVCEVGTGAVVAAAANSAVIAVISACHVNSNNAKLYDSLVRSSINKQLAEAAKGSKKICKK